MDEEKKTVICEEKDPETEGTGNPEEIKMNPLQEEKGKADSEAETVTEANQAVEDSGKNEVRITMRNADENLALISGFLTAKKQKRDGKSVDPKSRETIGLIDESFLPEEGIKAVRGVLKKAGKALGLNAHYVSVEDDVRNAQEYTEELPDTGNADETLLKEELPAEEGYSEEYMESTVFDGSMLPDEETSAGEEYSLEDGETPEGTAVRFLSEEDSEEADEELAEETEPFGIPEVLSETDDLEESENILQEEGEPETDIPTAYESLKAEDQAVKKAEMKALKKAMKKSVKKKQKKAAKKALKKAVKQAAETAAAEAALRVLIGSKKEKKALEKMDEKLMKKALKDSVQKAERKYMKKAVKKAMKKMKNWDF